VALIREIDVRARGEVVDHLARRRDAGAVKECHWLRLEDSGHGYAPLCHLSWASMELDPKVKAMMPGVINSHAITWPRCPEPCHRFEKMEGEFHSCAGRDQYEFEKDTKPKHLRVLPDAPQPTDSAVVVASPRTQPAPEIEDKFPSSPTMEWFLRRVPATWWWFVGVVAVVSFSGGLTAARIGWVREALGIGPVVTSTPSGKEIGPK
jgi:hypothetical protein